MDLQTIRQIVQNDLDESGTYRTDAFLNRAINNGYRLLAILTLFDERRVTHTIAGGRNHAGLPQSNGQDCLAPLYMANTTTGTKIDPAALDEFELYSNAWEGQADTDSLYYTLLSPYHYAHAQMLLCPSQEASETYMTIIGAFEPKVLAADTDEPKMEEEFQDLLILYATFEGFLGEPGRVSSAGEAVKEFMKRLNEYMIHLKTRYPSGRDFEPYPAEFIYSDFTQQQQRERRPKRNLEDEDEG